jgi:hypothetical protein
MVIWKVWKSLFDVGEQKISAKQEHVPFHLKMQVVRGMVVGGMQIFTITTVRT